VSENPVLAVRDLRIAFGLGRASREIVHGISFSVARGETLAIVGESGSGKSATALSIMGLLPKGAGRISGGGIIFENCDLSRLQERELRRLRGQRLAMIFQEPLTSLTPVLSIGRQMTEALAAHGRASKREARDWASAMLWRVGIADADRRLSQYPHELSGGMRQRVMIAMAMAMKPSLLIADEPTTALDVTVQAQILDLMRDLVRETGTSLILITHDMGVVAEMADRVLVMRQGTLIEEADVATLFAVPQQHYTKSLLTAVPRLEGGPSAAAKSDVGRPIMVADNVVKAFLASDGLFTRRTRTNALDGVTLSLMVGETLGLVGESGSGKSTLGRAIAKLLNIDRGTIRIDGEDLTRLSGRALRAFRSHVQMVFQDPYASLDPRFTIGRTVAEPIVIHGLAGRREADDRAIEMLRRVGLDGRMATQHPHELSGGQRQRVAIARALAANPKMIVADEPTSSLDVSVQAQVLELVARLREEEGIALLFISHDLAVVRRIASRVAVMRAGRILELGPTEAVLGSPRHVYTRALISSVPVPDPIRRNRPRIALGAPTYPAGPLAEVSAGHWVAS
jgi:ABC-type glutathione transport system ATPase component